MHLSLLDMNEMQLMQEIKEMVVKLTVLGFWLIENSVGLRRDGVPGDWGVEKVEKLAVVPLIGSWKKFIVKFAKNNKIKSCNVTKVAIKHILKLRQRKCKSKSK